jgi:hypothetical protein
MKKLIFVLMVVLSASCEKENTIDPILAIESDYLSDNTLLFSASVIYDNNIDEITYNWYIDDTCMQSGKTNTFNIKPNSGEYILKCEAVIYSGSKQYRVVKTKEVIIK